MCVWPGGVHGPSQGCRKNTRSSCTLFPAYSRHLMSVDSLLHAGGVPGGRVEGLPPSSPVGIPRPPSCLCFSGLPLGLGPTPPGEKSMAVPIPGHLLVHL